MNKSDVLKGLYAITPLQDSLQENQQHLLNQVAEAIAGGARIIQFRDKSADHTVRVRLAQDLARLCRQQQVIFLVNDDVTLALESQAHGVHLGADDMALAQARVLLGDEAIIGVSCYNRLDLAEQARDEGADYVAFGRFFPSRTKPGAVQAEPGLLQQAQGLGIPLAAIGGITVENAGKLVSAGAHMLAVVDAVFAQDDIALASSRLVSCLR